MLIHRAAHAHARGGGAQLRALRGWHSTPAVWQQLDQAARRPAAPHVDPALFCPVGPREEVDAEECDEAMEDLEETRRRLGALSRPPPGHVPLATRIKKARQATIAGVSMVLRFLLSVPGRLVRFAVLPRAERRATYAGWWLVIKKEARHYWLGTKLLWKDVRIARRLASKVLRGTTLSRRERQQLTRTTADIFRLVPFLVFVLVPFMELMLPVALKLFPNMLPSTFEDKLKKEAEIKRSVGAQLEVARFLQDTVTEMASGMQRSRSGETRTSAAELYEFMKRVRAGEPVSGSELLRFAKLFNDELTLDNLERVQLVSLCRFVGIQPFGTDTFLRARLRSHLQNIKEDDREIQAEGLETLDDDELRAACRARGMRTPYGEGAAAFMRDQLAEWLDWSLNRSLPSSLLLLSRVFTLTAPAPPGAPPKRGAAAVDEVMLRDTLCTLPDEAVEDVELFQTTDSGDVVASYERKLELLAREEELIREEEAATRLAVGAEARPPVEATAAAAAAAVVREAAAGAALDAVLDGSESAEERAHHVAEARQAKTRKILSALAALASGSGVASEREAFMSLVEKEIHRLEQQLTKRGVSMVFSKGLLGVDRDSASAQSGRGAARLADRVAGILTRVERQLDEADSKIGDRLHVLDQDNDGLISEEELRTALTFLREQLGEDDLRTMLEMLKAEAGEAGSIDVNKLMDLSDEADEAAGA